MTTLTAKDTIIMAELIENVDWQLRFGYRTEVIEYAITYVNDGIRKFVSCSMLDVIDFMYKEGLKFSDIAEFKAIKLS